MQKERLSDNHLDLAPASHQHVLYAHYKSKEIMRSLLSALDQISLWRVWSLITYLARFSIVLTTLSKTKVANNSPRPEELKSARHAIFLTRAALGGAIISHPFRSFAIARKSLEMSNETYCTLFGTNSHFPAKFQRVCLKNIQSVFIQFV